MAEFEEWQRTQFAVRGIAHQRVQLRSWRSSESRTGGRVAGKLLLPPTSLMAGACSWICVPPRGGGAGPVADPDRERVAAGRGRLQPAVVTAAHLLHHARLIGLREVHDGVGRLVGEVHVVVARELRRLAAGVVAAAATIVGLDVLPQVDAEGLHVGVGRGRAGVVGDRRRLRDGIVHRRRAAARTAGEDGDREQRP